MDTSRRQFLVGLASGLILPKFYDWTRNYVERTGEAPLMKVKDPQIILKANTSVYGMEHYTLFEGEIETSIPDFTFMSWREFADEYLGDSEGWVELWEQDEIDPDDYVEQGFAEETWILQSSSNGRAYNILSGYELNLTGSEPGKAGFIDFVECPSPGSNYRGVECDDLGLALLQKRLIDLDVGIQLTID